MSVEVAVLGPLALTVDGAPVDVPGPRRRAVLALLAMARGVVVSVDRLVNALWQSDPPPSAVNTVQWTALRNVAEVLARLGDDRRAALLLAAADADVDAPRVTGADAARTTALADALCERLGPAVWTEVRQEFAALSRADVVEVALTALSAAAA